MSREEVPRNGAEIPLRNSIGNIYDSIELRIRGGILSRDQFCESGDILCGRTLRGVPSAHVPILPRTSEDTQPPHRKRFPAPCQHLCGVLRNPQRLRRRGYAYLPFTLCDNRRRYYRARRELPPEGGGGLVCQIPLPFAYELKTPRPMWAFRDPFSFYLRYDITSSGANQSVCLVFGVRPRFSVSSLP